MEDMRDRIEDARRVLAKEKTWAGGGINWVATGKRLPGLAFRAALALPDGTRPAGLQVAGYFKQARIPGAGDKLYLNLLYRNQRIHALHENGPALHLNEVGAAEPLFLQRIGHPHRHRICDDAVEGYAEPVDRVDAAAMWTAFLAECNISAAPALALPITQLDLPL